MVFVGRTRELAELAGAVECARAGAPRVVLLEGDAGVGKSSLLARFAAKLDGTTVLRASGDEGETLLPYGVLDQLLGSRVAGAVGVGPRSVLGAGAEFLAVLGAAQEQQDAPVVVLVDDLHWADRESAGALLFACRRLRVDMVMVVVSRPGGFGRLGDAWQRFLAGDDRATRLPLAGFQSEELAELGRAMGAGELAPRALASLLEHTGGHPLYCRALLEELGPEALARAAGGALPAPRALAGAIVARVSGLPRPARALVLAASVLGPRARLSVACALAELDDSTPALSAAVEAGVLVESRGAAGPELGFVHPLVRYAVYDDLSVARRRELHARAAQLVDRPQVLDHRVAAAVAPAEPGLAAELEQAAADASAAGRIEQASRWLADAAALSADAGDRERRLLGAFEQRLLVGDVAGAATLEPEVEALLASARACGLLGHLALLRDEGGKAERLLLEAWERHRPPSEAPVGSAAAVQLTMLYTAAGRAAEALSWGRRAFASAPDASPLRPLAATMTAAALAFLGRPVEGLDLLSFLPQEAEATPFAATDVLVYRGIVRHWAGRPGGVRDLRTAAARLRGGAPLQFASQCLALLSDALLRSGEWDDAVVYGELAVSLSRDSDRAYDLPFVHGYAAFVPAYRGEWDVAGAHVEAAQAAARQSRMALPIAIAYTAAAALAAARSDHAAVLESTAAIRATGRVDTVGRPGIYAWRVLEAEALIELNRPDAARAAIDELEAEIPDGGHPSAHVAVTRLRGSLAAASGDHTAAAAAFASAVQLSRALGQPFEQAQVALADGRRSRSAGDPLAAISRLGAAREQFALLGARPYVERCDDELMQCGAATVAGSTVGHGLTPAQFAVARLVATGLTNKQTAAELFVTVKTVEFHLRDVFAKLGVSSRSQIAHGLGASA